MTFTSKPEASASVLLVSWVPYGFLLRHCIHEKVRFVM